MRLPFHDLPTCYEADFIIDPAIMRRFTVCRLLREAEAKLRYFVHAHFDREVRGLRWRPKTGLGKVAPEIVTAACQEKVDLIVMGKRKRRLLQRFLSRSVSEAVSRTAPCPVLTVCPPQIIRPWSGRPVRALSEVFQGSEA